MELNKKESEKFIKNMIKTEKSKSTKQEIQMAKDIQKNFGEEKRTFWIDYLKFKKGCIENDIFDLDEIIKLFEVWTRVSN